MTPTEIKIALLKKNISQRYIAKKLNVSTNAVSLVVNKKMTSNRIMDAVAKSIGVSKLIAFPEYFNHD